MSIYDFQITAEVISDLVQNIILLFALVFIYAATNINPNSSKIRLKIIIGTIIGGFTILLMLNPWEINSGLIFDTRSVLLGVSGLFFGPIATFIAAMIAIIYRLSIGGVGVYAGVSTILFTSLIGVFWYKIRKPISKMLPFIEYYIFGLVLHIVTLACFLLIPWPLAFEVIRSTTVTYLAIFPIVTMILALSLDNQRIRINSNLMINSKQLLLQASLDSTDDIEIFAMDTNYKYLAFNQFHKENMKLYHQADIKMGSSFIDQMIIDDMKERIKKQIDYALTGKIFREIVRIETEYEKYLEEIITPIVSDDNRVIGVTYFSEDVTKQTLHDQNIVYLSYNDPLTSAHNRRYYIEKLQKLDNPKYYPLTMIIADINGLKIVNDAFGHTAGDDLLKKVYELLDELFSKKGIISRIGGDEFTILLPHTSKEDAHQLILDAKKRFEKQRVMDIVISVSFGISTKESNEDIQDVFKDAEDDMYTHKLFEITSHRHDTINTILSTLREKNPREDMHSKRVSEICLSLGKALEMTGDDLNLLKMISNLHDIGKIAIDESILNKPGKLDEKEWNSIKKHPEIGFRILSSSPEYAKIAQDILSHHERYDGKGYPRGIKGEEIPIRARIISVADSYDAMISERPYRKPLTHQEAIEEIRINMGKQFDPQIAKLFIELFEKKMP
ncbi:MAG: diguanylate cyclase [Acholeplasmataceae bacterium]|nr:diguanylate cyclase [Acholeplasmataceae bacterium]